MYNCSNEQDGRKTVKKHIQFLIYLQQTEK